MVETFQPACLRGQTARGSDHGGQSKAGPRRRASRLELRCSRCACRCRRFPLLVIAPSSVLDNWSREFQTWGAFKCCMYSEKKKSGALSGITAGTHEIMLVSFDTFRWQTRPG